MVLIQSGSLNFTEHKLLKLINSIKADFLFASLNLNTVVQPNARQMHFLWMML